MTTPRPLAALQVPDGWGARVPGPADVPAVAELQATIKRDAVGSAQVDAEATRMLIAGPASWTRRQLVVVDGHGAVRAWASVHDRAKARTGVIVDVDPTLPPQQGDDLADRLYDWARAQGEALGRLRQIESTTLDSGAYVGDRRTQSQLTRAGYARVRTWLQMTRPVTAAEARPDAFPPLRDGVTVRRVGSHPDGSPVAADLQAVHLLIEQSFADHWGSHRESFAEFVQRLREDPGHRWDHWWLATVMVDGTDQPAGAVVSSVLPAADGGVQGSYIDYIGVHRRARGRGVAKALLHSVIQDAAARGRDRVDLEVDADSPTGADGLYLSQGWVTKYRTESWHRQIPVPR